jgi:hypothetical protein
MAEIARIYQDAGLELNQQAIVSAQKTSQRNVQHRFGKHTYDLADFGLTREQIEKEYAFYRQRYGIPYE